MNFEDVGVGTNEQGDDFGAELTEALLENLGARLWI